MKSVRPVSERRSTRGHAIKSVEEHDWYKRLRAEFPDEDECWVWTQVGYQVSAGAFREDAGVKVSVRKYLHQELLGAEPVEPYRMRESCAERCVNPRHLVSAASSSSVRGRPASGGGELLPWDYLHPLVVDMAFQLCNSGLDLERTKAGMKHDGKFNLHVPHYKALIKPLSNAVMWGECWDARYSYKVLSDEAYFAIITEAGLRSGLKGESRAAAEARLSG